MPANDTIYDAVKAALVKDGWRITHDPYTVKYGGVRVHADLGAEKVFAAERGAERIAVEVKSFIGPSPVHDFEEALGQFMLYLSIIKRVDAERKLYLAIDHETHDTLFARDGIRAVLEDHSVARVVVNVTDEEVVSWIA
jgi:hypothetical protein